MKNDKTTAVASAQTFGPKKFSSVFLSITLAAFLWPQSAWSAPPDTSISARNTEITFNKNIAPIIFQHCSLCHRTGQPAPFELLTYDNVRKRARQIVEVTQKRIMPPWPPDPDYSHFANERRLGSAESDLLQQWVERGTPEGQPGDLPAPPQWRAGWLLGKPDLEATMTETYHLPAEGPDIYRNFVISIPLS